MKFFGKAGISAMALTMALAATARAEDVEVLHLSLIHI